MNAVSEGAGFVKAETRSQQSSLVQQGGEILDGAVARVGSNLLLEGLDDRVLGVEFEGLLGGHVRGHAVVTESLSLHDTFHVGRPTELTGGKNAWGVSELVGDDNLLNLVATQNFLDVLAKVLELLFLFFAGLLLFLIFLDLDTFLGNADKLLIVIFLELGGGVFINRVGHQKDFNALLLETFQEWRVLNGSAGLASDVVDVLLLLGHASDIVLERSHLVARLGGVVTEEVGKLLAVLGVFVDTELEVLGEGFVELVKVLLVFSDFSEHFKALLDEVLADNLQNLVLLEHLTRNVERQVLRVDDTLHEVEPFRDQFVAVIHNEDTADVQLDVIALLLGLEQVEGSTLGDKEDSAEFKLTFNGKVLDSQVVLPVVGESLVELRIFFRLDVFGVAGPERLGLVKFLRVGGLLLDGLLLLFVLLLFLILNFFDLGLLIAFLDLFSLVVRDFLLDLLFNNELDRVGDEFRVFLDNILDSAFLKVLELNKEFKLSIPVSTRRSWKKRELTWSSFK